MAEIRRCPHTVDTMNYSVNVYCTKDGTQIELCEDCTADLLDSLIVQLTTKQFDEWQKQAEQESQK